MGLLDDDFRYLLFIRSLVFLVLVASELILEPYYPNRFAPPFGFDQGVPSNNLNFSRHLRWRKNLMGLAQAFAILYARNTMARFHIPYSYYEGHVVGITILGGLNQRPHI